MPVLLPEETKGNRSTRVVNRVTNKEYAFPAPQPSKFPCLGFHLKTTNPSFS